MGKIKSDKTSSRQKRNSVHPDFIAQETPFWHAGLSIYRYNFYTRDRRICFRYIYRFWKTGASYRCKLSPKLNCRFSKTAAIQVWRIRKNGIGKLIIILNYLCFIYYKMMVKDKFQISHIHFLNEYANSIIFVNVLIPYECSWIVFILFHRKA